MATLKDHYSLEVVAPDFGGTEEELAAWNRVPKFLEEARENLQDLLPEGWEVSIRFKSEEAVSE